MEPSEFIPLAETAGLVHHIDRAVLEMSCAQLAAWQRSGRVKRNVTISVNVSARQLSDSGLLQVVTAAVARWGIDPASLLLEITESVVMTDVVRSLRILAELRALGVRVPIDDFGTGYSSLAYFRELPVDYLNIDQSFVKTLSREPALDRDRGLIAAIIDLSHHLGLTVIAEGVENEQQLGELRTMTTTSCGEPPIGGRWSGPAPRSWRLRRAPRRSAS